MTAVYGGSKTVIDPVVLPYMFGTTYPIFDAQGIVSEYVRNPDLAEYVRWEYRPADRSSVLQDGTPSARTPPNPGSGRIRSQFPVHRRSDKWFRTCTGERRGR